MDRLDTRADCNAAEAVAEATEKEHREAWAVMYAVDLMVTKLAEGALFGDIIIDQKDCDRLHQVVGEYYKAITGKDPIEPVWDDN